MLQMRLAARGGRSLAEFRAAMPADEWPLWLAYAQLEPFGAAWEARGPAQVAAMIANVHRKPGSTPFQVKDFMPEFRRAPKTPDEMLALFDANF